MFAYARPGGEDHLRLLAEGIVTADARAGGREDLVLHARERGGRIDRIAAAAVGSGRSLQLTTSGEKKSATTIRRDRMDGT